MRAPTILLPVLFLLPMRSECQTLPLRTYGGYANDHFHAIAAAPSNNLYVAGTTGSLLTGTNSFCGWLLKVNSVGDTLWSRSYAMSGGVDLLLDVETRGDSQLICGGTSGQTLGVVMVTDTNGVPLWVRMTTTVPNIEAVDNALDGGIYAAGSGGGNAANIAVYKLDSVGNTQWGTLINTGYEDLALDVTTTPDSGVVVSGSTRSTGMYTDGFMAKLDRTGTLLWSKAYGNQNPGEINNVINVSSGGMLAAGTWAVGGTTSNRPMLLRLDAMGDTLWTRSFTGYPDGWGMQVLEKDSSFLLYSVQQVAGSYFCTITVLDTSGNFIATHTFGSGEDSATELAVLPDGRIAAASNTQLDQSSGAGVGASDGQLVILGADGSTTCERPFTPPPMDRAPVTITSVGGSSPLAPMIAWGLPTSTAVSPLLTDHCSVPIGMNEPVPEPPLLFPVPSSEELHVQFRAPGSGIMHVQVFDLSGRGMLSEPFSMNGAASFRFDVRDLDPGPYVLRMQRADGSTCSAPFLVAR